MDTFKRIGLFISQTRNRAILAASILILSLFIIVLYNDSSSELDKTQKKEHLEKHSPYNSYVFSDDASIINVGDQPYLMPSALVFTVMQRDRVFLEELKNLGFTLKVHHFLKGNDINYFIKKGQLDGGFSGDMPTLRLAAEQGCSIVSSAKGPISIVSRNIREVQDLSGKKVAYPFGSNAHFYLLKTLKTNNVALNSIRFFEMEITQMEKFLQNGQIDAYSTWEFTPPTTVQTIQNKTTTHKGITYIFLSFTDSFAKENPEAVKHFIAAQIRAVRWLRQNKNNVNLVSLWLYETAQNWKQRELPLSLETIKGHVLEAMSRVYLDEIPRIPEDELEDRGQIKNEFLFLKEAKFIKSDVLWEDIKQDFKFNLINEVIANDEQYRLNEFSIALGKKR